MNTTHISKQKIFSQATPDMALFLENMREMGFKRNIPNISWNTAGFLIEMLRTRNISQILEIGPANGFSTMMLALACPEAQIISIECSRHAFEELRHNIGIFELLYKGAVEEGDGGFSEPKSPNFISSFLSPFAKGVGVPADFPPKVTSDVNQEKIGQFSLYYSDAREVLPAFLQGSREVVCSHPESIIYDVPKKNFDCIFIDGAFRMTREFFDLSRPLLSPQGIIIIDDAIKYRWKMEGFHEYLEEQNIVYELVQTDEDDGVMVIMI